MNKLKNKHLFLSFLILSGGFAFAEYVSVIDSKSSYSINEANSLSIVERKETATGGYTIWSDGYKEAYGQYEKGSSLMNTDLISISLPFTLNKPEKSYVNANIIGRVGGGDSTINIDEINNNNIIFAPDGSHTGTLTATRFTWTVKGY